MKFPVTPESMSVVVLTVLLFPCSEMGKLIDLLLGSATSTRLIEWEDVEVTSLVKIHCSRGGDLSNLLSGFFKTGGKNFKDVGLAFPQSFE